MIVTGLLLNVINASSMQWTQSWGLEQRKVYAYIVCFTEGFCSTVMFACCLPDCHRTAELARHAPAGKGGDGGAGARALPVEAATNYVTSLFVTLQTIGGLLGPFIGAPLLAGTSNPFGLTDLVELGENPGGHIRVAIPTMCSGMLVVALLMIVLMLCGCVPNGKGLDKLAAAGAAAEGAEGAGGEEEDEEREGLLVASGGDDDDDDDGRSSDGGALGARRSASAKP